MDSGERRPGQGGRGPARVGVRVDRAAEHHDAERVRDVPERLGEAAGDRVDARRANAREGVDDERVGPELEPLGERADDGSAAVAELLRQQRERRYDADEPLPRRDPGDRARS